MWPFKRKDPMVKVVRQQRKFAAAAMNNLLNSWTTQSVQIDKDIKAGGAVLRARARDTSQNNVYARKYLNILKTNVVGDQGIRLQCQAVNTNGSLDQVANQKIETAWASFGRSYNCSFSGTQSLIDMQRQFISTLARDGEVLIRKHIGAKTTDRLRMQFLDVGLLDEQHNEDLKGGRRIRMGIEYDANDTMVAVWLTDKTGSRSVRVQRERVPASEVIYKFDPEFANQHRGFSWMAASMVEMHHLAAFQEAAIIAGRVGASNMGFFTQPLPYGSEVADNITVSGDVLMDAEPGTFRKLPAGVDFKMFESKYPSDMVDGFVKRGIKSIASGLNVNYNSLAADPENTSYSTMRQFALEDRDYFRTLQRMVIESFLEPVYLDWLRLNVGRILNADRYAKMTRVRWQPRGWQWVDPTKDAVGMEKKLAARLTAPSILAAEMGLDFEEICQQAKNDQDTLKRYDLLPEETEAANA